ncbi:MAG: LacI family transcriptional regulator [Cellulomonadaceae bacterium]|nr:LacI family transcriptional regulator [Cellulomonadaceae bacterium]
MGAPRLQDVADLAGVSMKTVSNVVRNAPYVSEKMRLRVQAAIDELGYRPNAVARRLATGRTGLVMLAFADVGMPYFAELARTVAHQAQLVGYRVLIEETNAELALERDLMDGPEAGLIDGVIFQPSAMSTTELARYRTRVPFVLLGETVPPPTVDHVMIDNVEAATRATQHLIDTGCRRIGFVGHEADALSETSRQRLEGYGAALEAAGLPREPELLIASSEVSAIGAVRAVGAALDAGVRFDALVCRDDLAAIGALRALAERGILVPDDVRVTGWDDIRLSAVTFPSLTTIGPDVDALAARAVALLLERIAGFDGAGRHELVPYELVVRESAPDR